MNAEQFLKTIAEYNAAVTQDVPFNPNIKDGRRTVGLAIAKSNWANTIDTPPFEGYAVTCGITFTFGGVRINTDGEVLNTDYQPIRGLYAAGELVGGLFYFNYPGGTGLTLGRGVRQDRRHVRRAHRQELRASMTGSTQTRARAAQATELNKLTATEIVRAVAAGEATCRGGRARLPGAHRRPRRRQFTPGPASIPSWRYARRASSTAPKCAGRCMASRSASRTSSTPPISRPRWARRSIAAIDRRPMPPASGSRARPAR